MRRKYLTQHKKTWLACALGNDLMEVIEDWHEYIAKATIADVVLERLLHGAHRLNLARESMCRPQAQLTERDRSV